ncbi:hypothetical protein K470DRAFT_258673 [Piedraia hortae CBS 480.64]|uniref:Uncharacterized protein n=1 Tax=Piedraia hortae CBS 480.64 TaxID=1314780 RepID=A0A6A7BXF3_9PEZI|nr:hypothetical protein K470DRAFT_258673 [Piedraia hortae CBS 480.64]
MRAWSHDGSICRLLAELFPSSRRGRYSTKTAQARIGFISIRTNDHIRRDTVFLTWGPGLVSHGLRRHACRTGMRACIHPSDTVPGINRHQTALRPAKAARVKKVLFLNLISAQSSEVDALSESVHVFCMPIKRNKRLERAQASTGNATSRRCRVKKQSIDKKQGK